jgi:hypothetical protein
MDRVPVLLLGDLVAAAPGYSHPEGGASRSFVWYSERELSFTALMTSWGYNGKVRQSGVYMHSMVWCEFVGQDEMPEVLAANVDNTFDSSTWESEKETTELGQWRQDIGTGARIAW